MDSLGRVETNPQRIASVLEAAIEKARRNREGAPAAYIPELANVPLEVTSAAVTLTVERGGQQQQLVVDPAAVAQGVQAAEAEEEAEAEDLVDEATE